MPSKVRMWALLIRFGCSTHVHGQNNQKVIDIDTRPGVTQRMVVLSPPDPRAAVILFAGGHGGLQIFPNGSFAWGDGNFLVRTRQLFAQQGLLVAVVDAPSDRQSPPYLSGFRQRPEHAADIKEVIACIRVQANIPAWLVGTSRGTQSAAYVASQLSGPEGPNGLVLTSTILTDDKGRPVPAMPIDKLGIPVLVVHHEQDGCGHCSFDDIPVLMKKLAPLSRTQLLTFKGGKNRGDPCEAQSYHGFNGLENEVVAQTAKWMLSN